jgi:uncharacterized protein YuzE
MGGEMSVPYKVAEFFWLEKEKVELELATANAKLAMYEDAINPLEALVKTMVNSDEKVIKLNAKLKELIEYDNELEMAYIKISDEKIVSTCEQIVNVDLDNDGEIVGVELFLGRNYQNPMAKLARLRKKIEEQLSKANEDNYNYAHVPELCVVYRCQICTIEESISFFIALDKEVER